MRTRTALIASTAAAVLAASCATAQAASEAGEASAPRPSVQLSDIVTYERAAFSRDVTACDELAGHPDDPEKVVPGVSRAQMDKPAAIAACTDAVAADPDNPRLNYQLARAYAYADRHAEGDTYRIKAIESGYPQSLFVFGYIRVTGWDGDAPDPCLGGELIRRSAHAGRFAGLVGFPHYALEGAFEGCASPVLDADEMHGFLDAATTAAGGDFYKSILISQLRGRLQDNGFVRAEPLPAQ